MSTIGAAPVVPPGRTVRLAGREYPLVLPSIRDPRLHLASVIITVQILGQTSFGFGLSIAQILCALVTSALLEVVIVFATKRVVAWPASAMLTGSGVALVLRVPGTRHGDWWSLHGAWIFVATAAVSLLSKYLIRRHGRHVFNPSNLGLLVCFLSLGSNRADPLDLWWARMSPALAFSLAVIVGGGLIITRRTGMIGAAVGFWVTFAALIGILAASGHCMTARWHIGPICGGSFWFLLVTSPEILVFLFFMITDPRTAPENPRPRRLRRARRVRRRVPDRAPAHRVRNEGRAAGLARDPLRAPSARRAARDHTTAGTPPPRRARGNRVHARHAVGRRHRVGARARRQPRTARAGARRGVTRGRGPIRDPCRPALGPAGDDRGRRPLDRRVDDSG